jgi:hypothetical protein
MVVASKAKFFLKIVVLTRLNLSNTFKPMVDTTRVEFNKTHTHTHSSNRQVQTT